jgi:hypothetical protein
VLIPGISQGNYHCGRNSKIITWALQKPVTMAIPVRGIIPRQGFDIVTGTSHHNHLCGEHLLDRDLKGTVWRDLRGVKSGINR